MERRGTRELCVHRLIIADADILRLRQKTDLHDRHACTLHFLSTLRSLLPRTTLPATHAGGRFVASSLIDERTEWNVGQRIQHLALRVRRLSPMRRRTESLHGIRTPLLRVWTLPRWECPVVAEARYRGDT